MRKNDNNYEFFLEKNQLFCYFIILVVESLVKIHL